MPAVKPLTRNARVLAEASQQFNQRNLNAVVEITAGNFTYTDHAEGTRMRGAKDVIAWMQEWLVAFPDAQVTDASYVDAGDAVVETYSMRGTHEGPFGEFPATGEQVDFPVCEVWRFNDHGQAVSADMYYDRLTMLTQIGLIEMPKK